MAGATDYKDSDMVAFKTTPDPSLLPQGGVHKYL